MFIAAVTCFFSFGIQSLFYLVYRLKRSALIKKEKTVFDYLSGVIGDGVLVPSTNIFAVQTLQYTGADLLNMQAWLLALPIGFAITFSSHYYQQKSQLTNWTMPKIGRWNTLGFYHAFFMFWETTFLGYSLISQIEFSLHHGLRSFIYSPIKFGLLALTLFLLTFFIDYWKSVFKEFAADVFRSILGFEVDEAKIQDN